MKHSLLLFTFLQLFIATVADAQLVRSAGFKLAYTSANQKFEDSRWPMTTNRRPGFNFGIFVEWFQLPSISIVTQVEYAQRGMQEEIAQTLNDPTPVATLTLDNRVDYLSIPLLVKARVPIFGVAPFLLAGPRVDMRLSYRADDQYYSTIYSNFKRTVLGGSVGAGFEIPFVSSCSLILEGRYNFDLTDSIADSVLRVRNNAFDIWLGVAF